MKKTLLITGLCVALGAQAATTVPPQLMNPTGSVAGQAITSGGPSSAPTWGLPTAGFWFNSTGLTSTNLAGNCSLTIPATNYCVNYFGLGGAGPFDTATLSDPSAFVNGFSMVHNYGAGHTGGRQTFYVQSTLAGASGAGTTNRNYVAGVFYGQAASGDGGTNSGSSTTSKGAIFALNPVAVAYNGATNLLELTGAEFDMSAQTGSSMWYKAGMTITQIAGDAVRGTVYDAGLSFSNAVGTSQWKNGIMFSHANGAFPIATTGCLICTVDNGTATTGLDFSSIALTGNFLNGPGGNFSVNGSTGALTANSGTFSSSLSAAFSNAGVYSNDTSATNNANFFFMKNGTTVWDWYNASSTGLLSLGRFVSGTLTDNPITVSNSTGVVTMADGIAGATTAAGAGTLGELQTNTTTGTSLTSGTSANLTSISLPAGVWDCSGTTRVIPASGTTTSQVALGVSTTSATLPGFPNNTTLPYASPATQFIHVATPVTPLTLASTTTVYLVGQVSFAVSTLTADGYLRCRRVH